MSVKSREHSSQTLSCRDFYDGNFLASSVGEGRSLTNRGGQGLSLQNKCFQKISSWAGHLPKSCEILFLKVSFFFFLSARLPGFAPSPVSEQAGIAVALLLSLI